MAPFRLLLLPVGMIIYATLITILRRSREARLLKVYRFQGRNSYRKMTVDQAHLILKQLAEVEAPLSMEISFWVALFRTYGIPSIAKLLIATTSRSSVSTASKRTADTLILLQEFFLNPPSSKRTLQSLTRINYLHARHRISSKVTDDDMLYTLSIFATAQGRWMALYDHRPMSELELCASGVFYKWIGEAMETPYDALASSATGWTDGTHWLDELSEWSEKYEKAHMIPNEASQKLANQEVDIIAQILPWPLRRAGKQCGLTFLDERLRIALGLRKASRSVTAITHLILHLGAFTLKFLVPPFLPPKRRVLRSGPNSVLERHHVSKSFVMAPWYTQPESDLWKSLRKWLSPAHNLDLVQKSRDSGYHILEVGPTRLEGKGRDEMAVELERLGALYGMYGDH